MHTSKSEKGGLETFEGIATGQYYPPEFLSTRFHCPVCGVLAHQAWDNDVLGEETRVRFKGLYGSRCTHCNDYAVWREKKMISPDRGAAPLPNPDSKSTILGGQRTLW